MTRVCSKCGNPKLPPSAGKNGRAYYCSRCINSTPAGKARRKRYMKRRRQTAAGKAAEKAFDARRIIYGDRYFGVAQTAEQAEAIKAHIRRRVTEFTLEQKNRYESRTRQSAGGGTEAPASDAVQLQDGA